MRIGDIIKNKDYDYISYRVITHDEVDGGIIMIFSGCFKSEGGKIISLDGDTYSEDEEVIDWETWSKPEKGIMNGLTVAVKGEVWRKQ